MTATTAQFPASVFPVKAITLIADRAPGILVDLTKSRAHVRSRLPTKFQKRSATEPRAEIRPGASACVKAESRARRRRSFNGPAN